MYIYIYVCVCNVCMSVCVLVLMLGVGKKKLNKTLFCYQADTHNHYGPALSKFQSFLDKNL